MVKGLRRPRHDCTILQPELCDTIFEHRREPLVGGVKTKYDYRIGLITHMHMGSRAVKGTSGARGSYSSQLPCYDYHAL